MTYRMGAHTTSDDPTKYRTSDEEESWARATRSRACTPTCCGRGASDAFFADVEAEAPPWPTTSASAPAQLGGVPSRIAMFDHVYTEPHPLIDEQRAWLAEYEASFEEGAS